MPKRTIAQRVNDYLAEAPDAQFVNNKWKFWFIAVAFLSVINAGLTWLIFRDDAENYSGPVMLSVGALVAWLCVCALHYTDSANRTLARSVSVIDSIALLFVVVHFAGLLYIYGHHRALRSAEARYEQQSEKFNVEAKQVQDGNVKIAEAQLGIARENTKRAKLENDSAYQLRKAAEAGGVPRPAGRRSGSTSAVGSDGPALAASAVELERPTRPAESSTAFLTKWDWTVRAANCVELLLAVLTLILIRNVSAKSNSPGPAMNFDGLFSVASRTPTPRPALATKPTTPDDIVDDTDNQQKTTQAKKHPGLARLRECLKAIAFANPPGHFKVDVKDDYLIIRFMESRRGDEATKYSVRVRLAILDDALTTPAEAYRVRVEKLLRQNGFFEDRAED